MYICSKNLLICVPVGFIRKFSSRLKKLFFSSPLDVDADAASTTPVGSFASAERFLRDSAKV